jgi:phosphoserine phosphatase
MRAAPPAAEPAAAAPATRPSGLHHAQQCLRACDAVCFDVDSTVIVDEGIDELASFLGCGEAVAALTRAAMGGSKPFGEALAERLAVINPTLAQLEELVAARPPAAQLTPGIAELVAELQAQGKRVFLVSGGFRQMIEPVAAVLRICAADIRANTLLFNDDGHFQGHDPSEPTSRAEGKAEAVAELKATHRLSCVVMVGDGATDMEARDVEGGADAFIGFGGNQTREVVEQGADWFVTSFSEMLGALRAQARPRLG